MSFPLFFLLFRLLKMLIRPSTWESPLKRYLPGSLPQYTTVQMDKLQLLLKTSSQSAFTWLNPAIYAGRGKPCKYIAVLTKCNVTVGSIKYCQVPRLHVPRIPPESHWSRGRGSAVMKKAKRLRNMCRVGLIHIQHTAHKHRLIWSVIIQCGHVDF